MSVYHDKEFGDITLRRSGLVKSLKLSIAPNGSLRLSMPRYTPMLFAKRFINSSRNSIREMVSQYRPTYHYHDGMQIGKSHSIVIDKGRALTVNKHGQVITLTLPANKNITDEDVQFELRKASISALRIEAKSYLPKRLSYLARQYDYTFTTVRFSHASSRWGSCSSNKTISLNIALMKLDFELIDYVILHELAHTRHMDHSDAFWKQVAKADPHYQKHRKLLKLESPVI